MQQYPAVQKCSDWAILLKRASKTVRCYFTWTQYMKKGSAIKSIYWQELLSCNSSRKSRDCLFLRVHPKPDLTQKLRGQITALSNNTGGSLYIRESCVQNTCAKIINLIKCKINSTSEYWSQQIKMVSGKKKITSFATVTGHFSLSHKSRSTMQKNKPQNRMRDLFDFRRFLQH